MNKQIKACTLLSEIGKVESFISRYKQEIGKLERFDLIDINDRIKAIVKLSKEIRKQIND
jgi:hypothetical protein